jgi:hypothetical protein
LSDVNTIRYKNEKTKFSTNVQIYIHNKTVDKDIINVHTLGKSIPILLVRLSWGDMELLNIEKGTKIYINFENSNRIPLEIICNEDQKNYYIY